MRVTISSPIKLQSERVRFRRLALSLSPPMGLYDDLPVAKGDPAAEASAAASSVPASLAPAVRRMAAAAKHHQPPRPATATTATVPAPAPAPPPVPMQQRENSNSYYAASFGPFDDDSEEYDPQFPNDFSFLVARRENAAEEARLRAEAAAGAAAAAAAAADRERQIAVAAAEAAAAREREAAEEKKRKEEEQEQGREREWGEEEEQRPRAGLGSSVRPFDSSVVPVPDSERGMPLAAKMMAKMGWEQGKGLGKKLQGAPLPLVAKKTSARAAVVVPAKEKEEKKKPTAAAAAPDVLTSFSWPEEGDDSSRVVLLTNVAPAGLSEEALGATEDEIGMAATASGGLRSVSIFEVNAADSFSSSSSSSSYPRDALVRVFVEFGDATSAGRFARSVSGHKPFFGGNEARGNAGGVVSARPFPLERLREGRLAPEPGDVP